MIRNGTLIRQLLNEYQHEGDDDFRVEVLDMDPGIYYCQIMTPTDSRSIKVVVAN